MPEGFLAWWDTVELWVAQLWFPLQFVLVMAVLVPLCFGLAWLIDRVVDAVSARIAAFRNRRSDSVHES